MLNRCVFMGRLTKDPEIRYTQSNKPLAIARFTIAVERDFKTNGEKITDFISVEAWRQKAEFAEKYLEKGQLICVSGSLHQNNWTDKEGNKRRDYKLVVENIYFAGNKKQDENGVAPEPGEGTDNENYEVFEEFNISEDELPF